MPKGRRYKWLRWGALGLALVVGWMALMRGEFNPIARQLAYTQVVNRLSDLINDSISQQISAGELQYDRIIFFEKDENGNITALKTDMSEVNRLKTNILDLINEEILEYDTQSLGIPVGSVILPELFSGLGPKIKVEILSISNSDGSFHSDFQEAGINQTIHRLIMQVQVDVTVLVLRETQTFTVASEVVVAETIIVGKVPETFFQSGTIGGN